MTNAVTRGEYNIPKLIYDGSLTGSLVTVGDAEDFERLRDQVARSGVFFISKTDPTAAESIFFASVDSPGSIQGYRVYPHANGMQVLFVTIIVPVTRPNEMLYSGVNKTFAVAT